MGITRSTLPRNIGNLPLPFFMVIAQFLFMIFNVIQEIGDNENSPDSLNLMVNYHYQGENRVITR